MEKREPSHTAGNVNWYSHMENSMEVPQKMQKNYHMTQQPSFWVYIQLFVVVQLLSPVGLCNTMDCSMPGSSGVGSDSYFVFIIAFLLKQFNDNRLNFSLNDFLS